MNSSTPHTCEKSFFVFFTWKNKGYSTSNFDIECKTDSGNNILLLCFNFFSLSGMSKENGGIRTSNILPLKPGMFDCVIIDEASFCRANSAIPALYRAKHAVIIGDPMQLRPIYARLSKRLKKNFLRM